MFRRYFRAFAGTVYKYIEEEEEEEEEEEKEEE
jgi:hypothetical protein